jgi:hypothetical protein
VTDEEKKTISNAYHTMMATDGWSDLVSYVNDERELSFKRVDSKPAAELTLSQVCEEAGIRKGMAKILQHAEFKRDGV